MPPLASVSHRVAGRDGAGNVQETEGVGGGATARKERRVDGAGDRAAELGGERLVEARRRTLDRLHRRVDLAGDDPNGRLRGRTDRVDIDGRDRAGLGVQGDTRTALEHGHLDLQADVGQRLLAEAAGEHGTRPDHVGEQVGQVRGWALWDERRGTRIGRRHSPRLDALQTLARVVDGAMQGACLLEPGR